MQPDINMRRWRFYGLLLLFSGFAIDALHKAWMLFVYDIFTKQPVEVLPFLDLVMVWNYGVSYGLFQQETETGRLILIAFKTVAIIALLIWLFRSKEPLVCIALGLIIGGAASNLLDRIIYGAVADFFFFNIGDFRWYVFNLADVWIVCGVGVMLVDIFIHKPDKNRHASDNVEE
jgi:signal peptidase II